MNPADKGKLPLHLLRAQTPHAMATYVQRGANGKLHIDAGGMTATQQAEFRLHQMRFNDPALKRAKEMHKVADGVPDILQRSNAVNTVTDDSLLANPPMAASKPGTTPVPARAGQLTQVDIWQAPCEGIMGGKYALSAYDAYSTDFVIYPMKSKDQSPAAVNQYYLDSKADGVDVDKGGVLYSDNEIVLNSAKMDDVAAEHSQTRGNSNEYEPTGNAGVESVFRLTPREMRKMHIRANLPDEFWECTMMASADILSMTRNKDGKSPREWRLGKRPNLSRQRVIGCKVFVRKPEPWRQNKLDDRGVVGINLGRHRSKPGYWVWTPAYGLITSKHVTFKENDFPFKTGEFTFARQQSTGGGHFSLANAMLPVVPAEGCLGARMRPGTLGSGGDVRAALMAPRFRGGIPGRMHAFGR